MSRSISREDFNELKNYLGVYLQQGRVILDSDWNENQDIAVSLLRRLVRDALGEGTTNQGLTISPIIPPPLPPAHVDQFDITSAHPTTTIGYFAGAMGSDAMSQALHVTFGPLLGSMRFPGPLLEGFESLQDFTLSSPQGKLRIGVDQPDTGSGFLRLSGHTGPTTITKTLSAPLDLSLSELITFRYRLNEQVSGTFKFFLEDDDGNRSVWHVSVPASSPGHWLPGFAMPLDLDLRIVTPPVTVAMRGEPFSKEIIALGGKPGFIWSTEEPLPNFLKLQVQSNTNTAVLSGTVPTIIDFSFAVKVTDDNGKGVVASQVHTVHGVSDLPQGQSYFTTHAEYLAMKKSYEVPTGKAADLTQIRKYGFEVYQDPLKPLIWDFDSLHLGSRALQETLSENNFIIQSSWSSQFLNQTILLLNMLELAGDPVTPEFINSAARLSESTIENAGQFYVAGLPCIQSVDTLYSQQADPNDPPLTPPAPQTLRKDTVYLDVWAEPVTYVEDPEIREIALGGPDTSTRLRTRHRVRVAQGGEAPSGNGIGLGTLSTEGSYTAQANRLYRVEIDKPGDIGGATFRWSDDNASTLQRVIEPIPAGSVQVTVEDASAFRPGDWVLIRKEFGEEEHQISAIFGNVITLQKPTGSQLALSPAASRVPLFTSFSLLERPMLQRWNAFRVPIQADPNDTALSDSIALNDGVKVRFGGYDMLKGNYWSFKTRYLAGDETSGINPGTRIERLAFRRAKGVEHHYVPLAVLTRDGSAGEPKRISLITDRRQHAGTACTVSGTLPTVPGITGYNSFEPLGGIRLPPSAPDTKFAIFLSGDLYITGDVPDDGSISLYAIFYNDEMGSLTTQAWKGLIDAYKEVIPLSRKPKEAEVPVQLLFIRNSAPFRVQPTLLMPTTVQVFAELSSYGFTVELANMRLTALALKKTF